MENDWEGAQDLRDDGNVPRLDPGDGCRHTKGQ